MDKEEQLVVLGDQAEALLKQEVFNTTINQLVEGTFQSFVNSKPENSSKREEAYAHYRALVDIVNTLQQRVSVRDEINKKNSDNNKEE
tara:strand:+ start:16358 stop:16621 length:264 start_codon:yes stop_codon:yes gene_type:complete